MRDLTKLVHPFPQTMIERNPSGGGSYVAHPVVEQRLLDVLGPVTTELVTVLRGRVPGRPPDPAGKSARAKAGTADLEDAVVGVVLRMRATVDGRDTVVEEVGDCESPHNWPHDGARARDAFSDAYKRCLATGTPILTTDGEVPVELVERGASVMTRRGWRRVIDAGPSYPEPVPTLTVQLSDGRQVPCTPEHRFLSPGRGFMRASDLQRGAMLLSWVDPPQRHASPSSWTASPSASTKAAPTSPDGTEGASGPCLFTATSTRSTTAPSPTVGMSTTSTETPATTTPATWSPSIHTPTLSSTGPVATPPVRPGAGSAASGTSLAAGGGSSPGAPSPAGTRTVAGGAPTARDARAASVAPSTSSTTARTAGRHAVAPAPRRAGSSLVRATTAGLTSSPVGHGLGSALALVSSVTPSAPEYVYSLTVEGEAEYFANGVLTHNCAMRLGVGLHLWAQDHFYLGSKLLDQDQDKGDGGES